MRGFLMRREKLLSKIRADENMDQTGERIVYLCDDIEGKFAENNETSESRYFSIDNLPPSQKRNGILIQFGPNIGQWFTTDLFGFVEEKNDNV